MHDQSNENQASMIGQVVGGEQGQYAPLFNAAARGWRQFPVMVRGKHPLITGWPKLATTDREQLLEWSRQYPNCNWGIATGEGSGVFVLDVDSDEALAQLERLGSMPRTFNVKTSRGQHFYFQYPAGSGIRNSASKLADGLDVRGEGGYVLLPPSVHPSGALYKILDDSDSAPAPAWLLKKLGSKRTLLSKSPAEIGQTRSGKKITEGSRNFRLTSLAGSMQWRGMSKDAIEAALLKENEERFDPPLGEAEVQQIVNSVSRYEPAEGKNPEVQLIVGDGPYAQMVPSAESILRSREAERIFQTPVSRRLVRIVQQQHDSMPDKFVRRDPEASYLTDVDAKYLQLALGRSGQVVKMKSNLMVPTDAPYQLADMILSSVRTSPEMTSWRRLKKISCTPILLPHGSIVMEPGYHAESQIWLDARGIAFVDHAADKPKLSARECKKMIEKNIYPFVRLYPFFKETAGQHWHETGAFAVVLSALMSIDDRHNLPAVPMHCVSAPTQSCGKTRLVQAICAAVTGTQPTIVTYDGVEEFAKHIPVLLGKGDSAICIDNIIMAVNNAKLAAMLTQEYAFNNRILGKSEDVTVENVSVLFATGVNLQLSGDMPTRCLMVRIQPEDERPEERRFPFDQIDLARELFPRATISIKSVLRAHQMQGFPGEKLLKRASRFPMWDKRVRAAIVWAGYADPIITQDAIRSDDPTRNESTRLLWILRGKFKDDPFQTRDLSFKISSEETDDLKQITGHRDSEALNLKKVGKYFSAHLRDRWFDGIRLVKTNKNQNGRQEWRIEAKLDAASFGVKEEPL
jgi:Bifunctional DNA primase/polymerase, N-terminal/Primase C terminal 1 (PriCT-1)